MQRAWQPEAARQEFYLYVDEFQNFLTDSFEPMLSETRKYGLNLVIANQHLAQLKAMGRLGDRVQNAIPHPSHGLELREMLIRKDRKSTRLNSSHEWISYAVC